MLEVAKLVPMFCPSAPKKLATDPQKEELLLLRRLYFQEGDWNTILIPLVCQMHEAIFAAGTNRSANALARFGSIFKEFMNLLKICRPDLKLEINLNVLSKDLIN